MTTVQTWAVRLRSFTIDSHSFAEHHLHMQRRHPPSMPGFRHPGPHRLHAGFTKPTAAGSPTEDEADEIEEEPVESDEEEAAVAGAARNWASSASSTRSWRSWSNCALSTACSFRVAALRPRACWARALPAWRWCSTSAATSRAPAAFPWWFGSEATFRTFAAALWWLASEPMLRAAAALRW